MKEKSMVKKVVKHIKEDGKDFRKQMREDDDLKKTLLHGKKRHEEKEKMKKEPKKKKKEKEERKERKERKRGEY